MHDCVSILGMSGSLLKRHMDFSDYIQICIKGLDEKPSLKEIWDNRVLKLLQEKAALPG